MHKRRLLKLADLLEADAKNKKGVKFDLNEWGHTKLAEKFIAADCSTAACALGLAAVSGAFRREGLRFILHDDGCIEPCVPNEHSVYGFDYGYEAAETLFSLSHEEARFLFSAARYPKSMRKGALAERLVAKRVRDFVAGTQTPPSDHQT